MEFPHLLQLIQQNQFDTIYHEHFPIFILTVTKIFAAHGLTLFDVEEIPLRRLSANLWNDNAVDPIISARVTQLRDKIQAGLLQRLETYLTFGEKLNRQSASY